MALWLLIFSLPFAKPMASVGGLAVTATDVLFVITAGAFAIALTRDLAPAVRLMTWLDAWHRFLDNPLIGTGIGSDAVAVRYVDPSGFPHVLTDAHNVFLNFAVQCGLIGVAAMILLIVRVSRITGPLGLGGGNAVRLGLGLAWLSAFAYEGLTGSYEDARHLWLLLGLLLASARLEVRE